MENGITGYRPSDEGSTQEPEVLHGRVLEEKSAQVFKENVAKQEAASPRKDGASLPHYLRLPCYRKKRPFAM